MNAAPLLSQWYAQCLFEKDTRFALFDFFPVRSHMIFITGSGVIPRQARLKAGDLGAPEMATTALSMNTITP